MTIELLGDNCKKCQLLKNNIELALKSMNEKIEFQFVCEPKRFAEYALLSLPGFAIDGVVRAQGRLLSAKNIVTMVVSNT